MQKELTIEPDDIVGRFQLLVELDKSIKRPEGDTTVISTPNGWLFPEDVYFYNHKDEWLYALGATHTWRTEDMNHWELVT